MTDKQTSACFIDSNIWIYALAKQQDGAKQKTAAGLIQVSDVVISTQVINEVSINLKKKSSFSEEQLRQLVSAFYQGSRVVAFEKDILTQASMLRRKYALSFWDSLIVASACYAKVARLYSEDMQHGLVINEQLEIVNPFR
ncbi:MAG: PIN domain-containing protein [Cyanobacteria bacterium J06629_9]